MIEESTYFRKESTEDFYRPASIRHLGDIPLYRAVAWWGFLLGAEFTRNDVSRAFRIDQRRASGILNYICNRHDPNDIVYRVRKLPPKHGNQLMSVEIIHIEGCHKVRRGCTTAKTIKQDPTTSNHDRLLAQWLLSRPMSSDIQRFVEWRRKCPCELVSDTEQKEI